MTEERRDPVRRAQTLRRIIEELISRKRVRPADLMREQIVSEQPALRILKRLAFRGLVREAEGVWVPRDVLLCPALIEVT